MFWSIPYTTYCMVNCVDLLLIFAPCFITHHVLTTHNFYKLQILILLYRNWCMRCVIDGLIVFTPNLPQHTQIPHMNWHSTKVVFVTHTWTCPQTRTLYNKPTPLIPESLPKQIASKCTNKKQGIQKYEQHIVFCMTYTIYVHHPHVELVNLFV